MSASPESAVIAEWDRSHPRFGELGILFDSEEDAEQLRTDFPWEERAVFLVALVEGAPVGLLKLVVHRIGADMGTPEVSHRGSVLYEGKVMEFVVRPEHRRRGIGRGLQKAAIAKARELGCYQLRSHSGGDRVENHQLKLSLGFAIDPIIRGDDDKGAYFLLPLQVNVEREQITRGLS